MDFVAPFTMEAVSLNHNLRKFSVADFASLGVLAFVQPCVNFGSTKRCQEHKKVAETVCLSFARPCGRVVISRPIGDHFGVVRAFQASAATAKRQSDCKNKPALRMIGVDRH